MFFVGFFVCRVNVGVAGVVGFTLFVLLFGVGMLIACCFIMLLALCVWVCVCCLWDITWVVCFCVVVCFCLLRFSFEFSIERDGCLHALA